MHDRAVGLFNQMWFAGEVDKVTGFGSFSFQIEAIVLVGLHDMRDTPVDLDIVLG